jgi:hypothetical protein
MHPQVHSLRTRARWCFAIACGALILTSGARAAQKPSPEEKAAAAAQAAQQLQATLFGLADRYVQGYAEILTAAVTESTPPEARLAAQLEKVHSASAVYSLAASGNPESALLDLMVLSTVRRLADESGWAESHLGKTWGERLVDFDRRVETEIWAAGTPKYLTAEQAAELRTLAETFHKENADLQFSSLVHFHDFLLERSKGGLADVVRGSRGMLGPLRDAVAAIDDVKLVSDRAMFLSVRLPLLMRWQVEALGYNMLSLPEARQILAATTDVTNAAALISHQLDTLPGEITKQREAFFTSIKDDLGSVGQVMTQVRDTLGVADVTLTRVERIAVLAKETTGNIDATAGHVEALMKTLGASPSQSETESFKPEQVLAALADARAIAESMLEFTRSAERMSGDPAAGPPPVVQATLRETEASMKRLIDRATLRAVEVLGAFTLVWIAYGMWRSRRRPA